MKTAALIFGLVLIAHVIYAGRVLRDAPATPNKNLTMEDVNSFLEKIYTSLKIEVEKVATQENLEKIQNAVQTAAQAAQKGLEDLKSKADEAMKSAGTS